MPSFYERQGNMFSNHPPALLKMVYMQHYTLVKVALSYESWMFATIFRLYIVTSLKQRALYKNFLKIFKFSLS